MPAATASPVIAQPPPSAAGPGNAAAAAAAAASIIQNGGVTNGTNGSVSIAPSGTPTVIPAQQVSFNN